MNKKLKTIFENAECPMVQEPSQKILNWLSTIGLDKRLIEEFSNCSRCGPIRVNKIYFNQFNELFDDNLEEQNKRCLENGYLIIGSGLNGDPIVLQLETTKVGYVSHDELWEEEDSDFKDIVAITDLDVFDFYKNAYSDDFPVDIHELEEKGLSI